MRTTKAWAALLASCLGNGMVGGPPFFVVAGDVTISCDPNADPLDRNLVLCERKFHQYPGCQYYDIDSWEDAHTDTYGPEGMCSSHDNTTTFWRTFCQPTRQCKCYTQLKRRGSDAAPPDYTDYEIHVDCSNMGLTEIPLGLPPDVHSLFLQGNAFTRLSLSSLVRALSTDLVNSTHDYPSSESTGPLMRLVGGEMNGGFPSLRRLYLHNNPLLTVIDDDAFLATQRVKELLLHHTGLGEIRRKSLVGLQGSLHTLWVQDSEIDRIQSTAFVNFSKLSSVWLYNNPISSPAIVNESLANSMFKGLDGMRDLVIDRVHSTSVIDEDEVTTGFSCCNLAGLEENLEARIYVGIGTAEDEALTKQSRDGEIYKKPLFCGDCSTASSAENGECWDEFDGCHRFNQDYDEFGYMYIYPYQKGHSYERPHVNSAFGRAARLWTTGLVVLVSAACSAGMCGW